MHKEMSSSTRTAISLGSQALTIFKGREAVSLPLLLERNQTNSKDGPTAHPGVLTSGPIVVLIALKLRAVPSKEAIRGT